MQSNKYKNKVGIIHCTSKRAVRQRCCREGCGLEGVFDPKIGPGGVLWNSRVMKSPLTEEPDPILDTVCTPLLYVVLDYRIWGQEHVFFLYYCLCTSHSTMGFVVKLRHSVSAEDDGGIYWLHSPSRRPKRCWGLTYKWEPRVGHVGATGQVTLLSPSPCRARSGSHMRIKLSACHPKYCYRATSAYFPKR